MSGPLPGGISRVPPSNRIKYDDQNISPPLSTPSNPIDDVQAAIDELKRRASISASPGFSWGQSGNCTSNTWLTNETVPSDRTGRVFPLDDGQLVAFVVSNELINTFSMQLYEHDGTTFTLLGTFSLTAQRSRTFTSVDFGTISITKGKELAVKVSSGSCKNPVVIGIFSGNYS